MAQGFVKNLNLVESNTQTSDRSILDNLGGENITSDVLLFDGNSAYSSQLKNDTTATTGLDVNFGFFTDTKTYKITEFGVGRNWASAGNYSGVTPAVGVTFVADASADTSVGTGGLAKEVQARVDFTNVLDPSDGYTIVVTGENRVAFSNKTLLSINNGTTYPYEAYNSNGEDRFQLVAKGTTNPIVNIADVVADITNCSLTRSDTISSENLNNLNPITLPTNDDAEGDFGDVESFTGETEGELEEGESGFNTFSQTSYIGNIVSQIKYKKTRVPLTYQDSSFDERTRVRGEIRIINSKNLEIGYPRGVNTALVELVEYKIISTGSTPDSFFNTVSGITKDWQVGDTFTTVSGSNTTGTTDANGATVKATNPPGLFIVNNVTNTEIRAFSGTDNPWAKNESTPAYITGNALTSSSDKVQVNKIIFDPDSSNTPILVKTAENNQSSASTLAVTDSGLGTTDSFTHKLPIEVNGEQYYLLVKT